MSKNLIVALERIRDLRANSNSEPDVMGEALDEAMGIARRALRGEDIEPNTVWEIGIGVDDCAIPNLFLISCTKAQIEEISEQAKAAGVGGDYREASMISRTEAEEEIDNAADREIG